MAGTIWDIANGRRGQEHVTQQGAPVVTTHLPTAGPHTVRFPNGETWDIERVPREGSRHTYGLVHAPNSTVIMTLTGTRHRRRSGLHIQTADHITIIGRTGSIWSLRNDMEAVDPTGQQLAELTETGQFRVRRQIVFRQNLPTSHRTTVALGFIFLRNSATSSVTAVT